MSFISYAQNFEDVMLWRALKHIQHGFYIDIGAQDPVVDSVSLAFYEHGWRGAHVEPTQQYSSKLRISRPDEAVFQMAVGKSSHPSETLTFYEFEDTGLSTADGEIARRHKESGFHCIETLVPVISLDSLFERIGSQEIHWLKLDVEGLEKMVLEGWRTSRALPWMLVIESTAPLSQGETHVQWEYIVIEKGYKFVYFDGLNRFYISPEHEELGSAFSSPPNIFDGFTLSGSASQPFYKLVEARAHQAESRAAQAESRAAQAESRAAQAKSRAAQAESRAEKSASVSVQLAADLVAVHQSTSWKITAPLRLGKDVISAVFGSSQPRQQLGSDLKIIADRVYFFTRRLCVKLIRRQITWMKSLVGRSPFILSIVKKIVSSSPRLKTFLARALGAGGHHAYTSRLDGVALTLELAALTPRARSLYRRLRQNVGTDEASP